MNSLAEQNNESGKAAAFLPASQKEGFHSIHDKRPEAAAMKTIQSMADNRSRDGQSSPAVANNAGVVQRKLLFDPGMVSYSLDGGGDDYAFVGKFKNKSHYVKYDDLAALSAAAADIWEKVKATYGGNGNMKKIKEGEAGAGFDGNEDLAPGEDKYEQARLDKTKLYLVGINAPGKDYYQDLVADNGNWENLNFYYPNNEDDDQATAMTAVLASVIAADDYDLFEAMLQRIMLNQGDPIEKNIGGGADRTAAATGQIYILNADQATFDWNDVGNIYKDKLPNPTINAVGDLSPYTAAAGAVPMKVGGKDAVYVTTATSKARTGKNFYIGGKAYTRGEINGLKADVKITGPWNALKNKTPVKQEAKTFSRKSRGKGQADAMGKWSANAAVVVSNIVDGTAYNEALAWEWLHLRGAGLGGTTAAGNLTPGTFSANSEMIPIENKIKTLKSNPDVAKLELDVEPKNVSGVFAKQIDMTVRANYKGILSEQSGTWTIDPFTGTVFDKIHEKKLKADLEGKIDEQIVGSDVTLYHTSGLMSGPCEVLAHIYNAFYRVELSDDKQVLAERQQNGNFVYDDNAEDELDD